MSFSEDMHIIPSLSMLTNGTIRLNGVDEPVFKVEVLPGSDSDPMKLEFGWKVIEMTERWVSIQMYFEEAMFVSANGEPDTLKITFVDKYMFVGKNNLPLHFGAGRRRQRRALAAADDSQFLTLYREMPTQIQLDSTAETAQAAATAAADSSKAFMIGNFIFNLLVSASLNQLWSLINTQQLIVLMPLFKTNIPANAG